MAERMAERMAELLAAASRLETGGLAEILAVAGDALRLVEPLRAVTLRHLRDGSEALARAASALGIDMLPPPGRFAGNEPRLLWLSPTESLLLSASDRPADRKSTR